MKPMIVLKSLASALVAVAGMYLLPSATSGPNVIEGGDCTGVPVAMTCIAKGQKYTGCAVWTTVGTKANVVNSVTKQSPAIKVCTGEPYCNTGARFNWNVGC